MEFGVSHSTLADVSRANEKNGSRVRANSHRNLADSSKNPEKPAETSLSVRPRNANHSLTETNFAA